MYFTVYTMVRGWERLFETNNVHVSRRFHIYIVFINVIDSFKVFLKPG